MQINPDVVLFKADKGTSKTLQLRIVRKLTVTKEFSSGEVPVPFGKACSQPAKVPLQGFGKIPVALRDGFPAKPPTTPVRFYSFLPVG